MSQGKKLTQDLLSGKIKLTEDDADSYGDALRTRSKALLDSCENDLNDVAKKLNKVITMSSVLKAKEGKDLQAKVKKLVDDFSKKVH